MFNRYTSFEYKKYAKTQVLWDRRYNWTVSLVVLFLAFLLWNTESGSGRTFGNYLWVVLLVVILAIIPIAVGKLIIRSKKDDAVSAALAAERNELISKAGNMNGESMKDINAKGHVVMAGAGAVVIVGSTVAESFNKMKNDDPELAASIQKISGMVEKSGNVEAGKAWARFLKELSGEKDQSVLSALWDNVVKLVPNVATLTESAAKIVSVIAP